MITDFIIDGFCYVGGVIAGLFGFTVPAWLVSCAGSLGYILSVIDCYDIWIPFDVLASFAFGLFGTWLSFLLTRILQKFLGAVLTPGGF